MSKNLTTSLVVGVVIVTASVVILTRPEEPSLPFQACGPECSPSPIFERASLLPATEGFDLLALRLRPDAEAARNGIFINIFADYDGNGRYETQNTDEWIVHDEAVNISDDGTDHIFPMPSAQTFGLNKDKFAVTVTASILPLSESAETDSAPSDAQRILMSNFIFDTEETQPVNGVFGVADADERQMAMQQAEVPDLCIGPSGEQVPCEDAPYFHFFEPQDLSELLNQVLGQSDEGTRAANTDRAGEFFNFFSEQDPSELVNKILDIYRPHENYWDKFGAPLEAPPEDTGSVLQYLTESLVIS